MTHALRLNVWDERVAICRLPGDAPVPDWISDKGFISVTRTPDELSVVCSQECVPGGVVSEKDWSLFKVEGPLDLELTGVLASLVNPLAKAGISVFSISTFDTDYLLVKSEKLNEAVRILGAFCEIKNIR